ncbi:WhiB family transcriptional regulator (plasmid) [Streptosporangium sandarakinum]|uniref:WhiB family transcriptional regulator n=1 Tax=Streptosporangium sandarakinum TaxID=1260955 RepID=UPI003D911413
MSRKDFLTRTWDERARCKGKDVNLFYKDDEPQQGDAGRPTYDEAKAKRICKRCPVRAECLADALSTKDFYGVRGGMNEEELRAENRRRRRRASNARVAERKTQQEAAA